jgi:hypothetical protein
LIAIQLPCDVQLVIVRSVDPKLAAACALATWNQHNVSRPASQVADGNWQLRNGAGRDVDRRRLFLGMHRPAQEKKHRDENWFHKAQSTPPNNHYSKNGKSTRTAESNGLIADDKGFALHKG